MTKTGIFHSSFVALLLFSKLGVAAPIEELFAIPTKIQVSPGLVDLWGRERAQEFSVQVHQAVRNIHSLGMPGSHIFSWQGRSKLLSGKSLKIVLTHAGDLAIPERTRQGMRGYPDLKSTQAVFANIDPTPRLEIKVYLFADRLLPQVPLSPEARGRVVHEIAFRLFGTVQTLLQKDISRGDFTMPDTRTILETESRGETEFIDRLIQNAATYDLSESDVRFLASRLDYARFERQVAEFQGPQSRLQSVTPGITGLNQTIPHAIPGMFLWGPDAKHIPPPAQMSLQQSLEDGLLILKSQHPMSRGSIFSWSADRSLLEGKRLLILFIAENERLLEGSSFGNGKKLGNCLAKNLVSDCVAGPPTRSFVLVRTDRLLNADRTSVLPDARARLMMALEYTYFGRLQHILEEDIHRSSFAIQFDFVNRTRSRIEFLDRILSSATVQWSEPEREYLKKALQNSRDGVETLAAMSADECADLVMQSEGLPDDVRGSL